MACVQGTWWGVGGGVVGGWVGSWFRGMVSGWDWVSGWGCLVGGGVRLVGPGARLVDGVTCGGSLPLDPSLTPAPARLVGCGSQFRSSPCWAVRAVCQWVSGGPQFFSEGVGWSCGWLVLLVVFRLGLPSTWGRGCGSRWSFRFGCVFVGPLPRLRAPQAVLRVGGLFPCWSRYSRWVGRPGRSRSPSPPLSPPQYTTGARKPSDPVGNLTR